jgi:dolichyl-phosphate-mannose--protein O-mannosyl transferase
MALSLWLPWVRIDRATFQYHFFTTLPFSILGLAYFLGEMWHGPSPRTWVMARVSAAIAVLAPGLLWLLSQPLCILAGTQRVNANSEACGGATRQVVISDLQAVALLLSFLALLGVAWLTWWWPQRSGWIDRNRQLLISIGVVAVLVGVVLAVVAGTLGGTPVFQMSGNAALWGLLLTIVGSVFAYVILRARDARRFAISAMVMAALWFVILYPNFSGLPIPSALLALINNLLPTYNWAFQFAVNVSPPSTSKVDFSQVGMLAAVLLVLCAAAFYAARQWRIQHAEERALTAMAQEPG